MPETTQEMLQSIYKSLSSIQGRPATIDDLLTVIEAVHPPMIVIAALPNPPKFDAIRAPLERAHHVRVHQAMDVFEVGVLLGKFTPQCMIIDDEFGSDDATIVCQHMREHDAFKLIPIVAVQGHVSPGPNFHKLGVTDIVITHLDTPKIVRHVEKYLTPVPT